MSLPADRDAQKVLGKTNIVLQVAAERVFYYCVYRRQSLSYLKHSGLEKLRVLPGKESFPDSGDRVCRS